MDTWETFITMERIWALFASLKFTFHLLFRGNVIGYGIHIYIFNTFYSWHSGLRCQSDNPEVVGSSLAGGEKLAVELILWYMSAYNPSYWDYAVEWGFRKSIYVEQHRPAGVIIYLGKLYIKIDHHFNYIIKCTVRLNMTYL